MWSDCLVWAFRHSGLYILPVIDLTYTLLNKVIFGKNITLALIRGVVAAMQDVMRSTNCV